MTPTELIEHWRKEAADLRSNAKILPCGWTRIEILELHARMLEDALGEQKEDAVKAKWGDYEERWRGERLVHRIAKAFFKSEERLAEQIRVATDTLNSVRSWMGERPSEDKHPHAVTFRGLIDKVEYTIGILTASEPDQPDHLRELTDTLYFELRRAKEKYGYTDGWIRNDWHDELIVNLRDHIQRNKTIGAIAFLGFAWYHKWKIDESLLSEDQLP